MRDLKGRFVKGHDGYWKGKSQPESTKRKLSLYFKFRKGSLNPAWKGGRIKSAGYISLWMPKHPKADAKGYIREHRYVMEQKLGRLLESYESVHHLDGDKHNNVPENLEVVTWAEHAHIHKFWQFK